MNIPRLSSCRHRFATYASIALITLSGCGGGGGSSPQAPVANGQAPATPPVVSDNGELLIGITDAEGDFISYIVDVTSIRLHRSNGDIVNALPARTRIDFTQLAEVTELLAVASVPAGNYTKAVLQLDYSTAEVTVQDAQGLPRTATLVDESGNALTTREVELTLEGNEVIRISPRTQRAFSLDFDLDASNSVDTTVNPPRVTVAPVLLATPELEADREHRVRGLLSAVDTANARVLLKVRPFRHRDGAFGEVRVQMASDASYEIDDQSLTGSAGLTALAAKPADTPVVAEAKVINGVLTASALKAGDSVAWASAEVVHGVVTARDAATLTVQGAAVSFADGRLGFRRELTVLVGTDTEVSAAGSANGDDLDQLDVSVGQKITVSGRFENSTTLDATPGRLHMQWNRVTGTVVNPNPLRLDLTFINGRRPVVFNFAGTGTSTATDADPDNYEVATANLDTAELTAGDLVHVRGFVNRFGFAPPDFEARTVVDVEAEVRGVTAKIGWPQGSTSPFTASTPTRLDLNLDGARAQLERSGRGREHGVRIDALALLAPQDDRGVYAVVLRGKDGQTRMFRSFAEAVAAMQRALTDGAKLHRITAQGRYTADEKELVTVRASFVFASSGSGNG
jgi:hypothetical protein